MRNIGWYCLFVSITGWIGAAERISFEEFVSDSEKWYECSKTSEVIIEIGAGTRFPLRGILQGDVLSLEGGQKEIGTVVVEQPVYLHVLGEDIGFSRDGTDPRDFWTFFTGSQSLGFKGDETGFALEIGGELRIR